MPEQCIITFSSNFVRTKESIESIYDVLLLAMELHIGTFQIEKVPVSDKD